MYWTFTNVLDKSISCVYNIICQQFVVLPYPYGELKPSFFCYDQIAGNCLPYPYGELKPDAEGHGDGGDHLPYPYGELKRVFRFF